MYTPGTRYFRLSFFLFSDPSRVLSFMVFVSCMQIGGGSRYGFIIRQTYCSSYGERRYAVTTATLGTAVSSPVFSRQSTASPITYPTSLHVSLEPPRIRKSICQRARVRHKSRVPTCVGVLAARTLKHPGAAVRVRLFCSSCRTQPNMSQPCVIPSVRPF